jgi:hypothetical protein
MRPFGPRPADAAKKICLACDLLLMEGDYTTLIPLGPGANEEAQKACVDGRPYNAVAVEVHYQCATGLDWNQCLKELEAIGKNKGEP